VLSARGYLAGDDDHRAAELNACLRDPEVRAIILARGGYGIMRILPQLDAPALRADPKVIVAYSDGTALLAWALRAAGVRGIHGPMACQYGELGVADRQWLVHLLEDPAPLGRFPGQLAAIGATATSAFETVLLGGNLCLLSHLVGTPWEIDFAGAALFFEEIGERPYAIDRFLTHLYLSGLLVGARAALVGDLLRCDERGPYVQPDAPAVVAERLRHFAIPALSGLPFGHGERNAAIPFGGRCAIDFDRRELVLVEGAVA
jgi:muramoyltetrapeptide carboxypeptidase